MYAGFPELYGPRPLIVVSHVLVALSYAGFRVMILWQKRKVAR